MKFNKKIQSLVSILALASILLTACSSAAASAPKFPTGRFVSTEDSGLGYIFNQDKTWVYRVYGVDGASGKYSVDGNRWTEKGTEECPFPGTYEWSFDGSKLTFKLVGSDLCEPRREATDGQTFILQK